MENKKTDLRKISSEELTKIKIKAIQLRDKGISNKKVAQKLNLDPAVISRWYRKYVKNHKQPQEVLKRGRKQGTHKKINDEQEVAIIKILQDTEGLLDKELCIKKIKYNTIISDTTMRNYLKKWGVSSSFIMEFRNEFVAKTGISKFQFTEQEIMKRQGIIIWLAIMEYELEATTKIYSISTRSIKNKLVFKFYKKPVKAVDVVEFINQVATLFKKHLYVIFSTENIDLAKSNCCFRNSEKITFITDI